MLQFLRQYSSKINYGQGLWFLGFLCVVLMGCEQRKYSEYATLRTLKKTRVEHSIKHHFIAFRPNQVKLTSDEYERVSSILQNFRHPHAVYIRFEIPDDGTGDEAFLSKRAAELSRLAGTYGIPNSHISAVMVAPQGYEMPMNVNKDGVDMVITQYMVIPPRCPDHSSPGAGFGCVTETNLALMIANPKDLDHGGTMGPSDAERHSLAIDRYRRDEVKELQIGDVGS